MSLHRFGPFEYDDEQRVLLRDGKPLAMQPKMLDTFAVLFSRRGEIVEKADLMKAVWPNTYVEETGLARNISQLRKAMGDEAGEYIETIPKRGYRLRAEPALDATTKPRRRRWAVIWAAALAAFVAIVWWQFYLPSRAVPSAQWTLAAMPLDELSPGLKQGNFATGMADVVNAALARIAGVNVISASVVERYRSRQIPVPVMSRLLRLHALLEGSAQVDHGRLRVAARMTDVRSGRIIWARVFEEDASDMMRAQSTIAAAIEEQTRSSLQVGRD